MKELSKWLQGNPFVVLFMFIVSLSSGLAGLILGWEQLYVDYLSKSIQLPVWLLILALLLLPAVFVVYRSRFQHAIEGNLTAVEGKRFGVQQLTLDGHSFERCEFHGTEVIYEGKRLFSLSHCSFHAPKFSFAGPAANTLSALTSMYKDPAFRLLIDRTIANIKAGEHPRGVPPAVIS